MNATNMKNYNMTNPLQILIETFFENLWNKLSNSKQIASQENYTKDKTMRGEGLNKYRVALLHYVS